ncbi:hypothetical protein HZC34_03380 [Candidatus Saganbacteria bacterium]|nr:hypothetical protein [Candidatus Saganbacteria bacterium]
MSTRLQPHSYSPQKEFLPLILGKDKLQKKDIGKIELFNAGLQNEIHKSDSVEVAIRKIVRMALAAEFGPSLVKAKGAEAMVETIVRGIMADNTLRKQAIIIIDKFAK